MGGVVIARPSRRGVSHWLGTNAAAATTTVVAVGRVDRTVVREIRIVDVVKVPTARRRRCHHHPTTGGGRTNVREHIRHVMSAPARIWLTMSVLKMLPEPATFPEDTPRCSTISSGRYAVWLKSAFTAGLMNRFRISSSPLLLKIVYTRTITCLSN